MNVTLVGAGRVGLVSGACLAEIGHDVLCHDLDARRISGLNRDELPFHEPRLLELVRRNRVAGRLRFTTDNADAVRHGDAILIAVASPSLPDGSADIRQVVEAAKAVGMHAQDDKVVILKSTVPVGTAALVQKTISEALLIRTVELRLSVVSNPEFLSEGSAVEDFMSPDRIVVGFEDGQNTHRARDVVRDLYAPLGLSPDRILHMEGRAAELTKYAANAMLATRISFMNELAQIAEEYGVDIEQVRMGIGSDPRIGQDFLRPGAGFGGSCLPKDCRALARLAADRGVRSRLLEAVQEVNQAQGAKLVSWITGRFGPDLRGCTFGVWGLAFKPDTDDMSDAPSRTIVRAVVERGATVVAHDPIAMPAAARAFESDFADRPELLNCVRYAETPLQALAAVDALIVITEWQVFRQVDWTAIKAAMTTPAIFDGRNLYSPEIRRKGFEYWGYGRR